MEFREWLGVQETLFNEDYKTAAEKFARENPETDREVIQRYVDEFKRIVNKKYKQIFDDIHGVEVPRDKRTNIDAYGRFQDLELVVDYVKGQVPNAAIRGMNDIEVDAKPVYEDDDLVIYYADTPKACIKYKGSIPYSWCVARRDSSNMFYFCRFKKHEPAFYFVKDKKKTKEEFSLWNATKTAFTGKFKDPWHFFVLQTIKNAKTSDEDAKQYIITSADNSGDFECNWKQVLEKQPLLEGLQGVFKPVPLTEEEKRDYERFSKKLSDDEFAGLTYDEKSKYMDIYLLIDTELTDKQFALLPDDLKNKYIGLGIGLSAGQFDLIKGTKMMKRYREVSMEKAKRIIAGEFNDAGFDYPYALNDSELRAIADTLDYKSMSIEDIGKLGGYFQDEYEDEEEDDQGNSETVTKGGWLDGIMLHDAFGDILERYAAAKGKLSGHEKSIMRDYHPSQHKAIELHGEDISIKDLEILLRKNLKSFSKKGFKDESVKKVFERTKEKYLAKEKMTKEEMLMILTYSESPEEDIKRTSDATIREVFQDEKEIKTFARQLRSHDHEGAIKALAERVVKVMDKLPAHPLLLAYAPDPKEALDRMGGGSALAAHQNLDLDDTFFGKQWAPALVRVDPDRMQKVGELILANFNQPLHFMVKGIAEMCRDPMKAIAAAQSNTAAFRDMAKVSANVENLMRFIKDAPAETQQKIAENIAASIDNAYSVGWEEAKSYVSIIRHAPDKAGVIKAIGNDVLKKVVNAESTWYDFEKTIESIPNEQLPAVLPLIKAAAPKLAERLSIKIHGRRGHIKSMAPEEFGHRHADMVFADDTPDEDRAEMADEVIRKTPEFNFWRDGIRVIRLIKHSSNREWALKTVVSKANLGVLPYVLRNLRDSKDAPFPGDEIQKAIEIIASVNKDSLSDTEVEVLLQSSPNEDRTASLVGMERLRKIAADPRNSVTRKWLAKNERPAGLAQDHPEETPPGQ